MTNVTHQFVHFVPDDLAEGTVYVSIEYATAVHKCCCGCGREVVTPLSPTDWRLIYDGRSISLDPSIGNWNFPCQSHYWIEKSRVRWARKWSRRQIDDGRRKDREVKAIDFHEPDPVADDPPSTPLWKRVRRWFSR